MSSAIRTPTARPDQGRRTWVPLLLGLGGAAAAPVVGVVLRGVRALSAPEGSVPSMSPGMSGVLVALGLSLAGLVAGVRALREGARGGLVWAGTVVSGLVLLLWGAIVVAEVVVPH